MLKLNMGRSRHFIGTWFKIVSEDAWKQFMKDCGHKVWSAQVEKCPTSGREHIQFYFSTKTVRAFSYYTRRMEGVHIEAAKCPREAFKYCLKEVSRAGWSASEGEVAGQGARTDLMEAAEYARKHGIRATHANPETAATAIKYHRHLMTHLQMLHPGKRYRPLKVIVLWGPTRSGKTSQVPDGAGKLKITASGQLWFDSCIDRKVIYLDDFYGQMKASDFLNLLDNYDTDDNDTKGSFTMRTWDTIYITSNVHPTEWYQNVPLEVKQAILQRLDEIIHVTKKSQSHEVGR